MANSTNITSLSVPAPYDTPVYSGYLLLFIIIPILLGNLLMIAGVRRSTKFKRMFYFMMISFAISDMLNAVLIMPVPFFQKIYGDFHFSSSLCSSWLILDTILQAAALMHICLLAYNTQMSLVHPLTYRLRGEQAQHVLLQYILVWCSSLLLAIPFLGLLLGQNATQGVKWFSQCEPKMQQVTYITSKFIPSFAVPFFLALGLCIWTGTQTHHQKRVLSRICSIVEHDGVICNGTQIVRNVATVYNATEKFKALPLKRILSNGMALHSQNNGHSIEATEHETLSNGVSKEISPAEQGVISDMDCQSVCRSISTNSSCSTFPIDPQPEMDITAEDGSDSSDQGITMEIDTKQDSFENTDHTGQGDIKEGTNLIDDFITDKVIESDEVDTAKSCDDICQEMDECVSTYTQQSSVLTTDTCSLQNNEGTGNFNRLSRRSLNEHLVEDNDIDLIIGPSIMQTGSTVNVGVENAGFEHSQEEICLADAIKVHSPSVRSTNTEGSDRGKMEKGPSIDSLSIDLDLPECGIRPGRRSILKRDNHRSLRKSVKFASDVNESSCGPKKLIRKGTKHVKVTHDKTNGHNSTFSTLSLHANGQLAANMQTSSTSIDYLSRVNHLQGKRASDRFKSEEGALTLLCGILILYMSLCLPYCIAFSLSSLYFPSVIVSDTVLDALRWIYYSSAFVLPFVLFVKSGDMRHHCIAACCCLPEKYFDLNAAEENDADKPTKDGALVIAEENSRTRNGTAEAAAEAAESCVMNTMGDIITAVVHTDAVNDIYHTAEATIEAEETNHIPSTGNEITEMVVISDENDKQMLDETEIKVHTAKTTDIETQEPECCDVEKQNDVDPGTVNEFGDNDKDVDDDN